MKALESQTKEFDKAIKALMELLPNVLISIPGIGPVYSAGIMAEIGDINVLIIRHRLLNMRGLPGNNTSPVDLKPKLQGSFHQATDF